MMTMVQVQMTIQKQKLLPRLTNAAIWKIKKKRQNAWRLSIGIEEKGWEEKQKLKLLLWGFLHP